MASEGAVTRVGRSKVTHTGSGLLISRAATKHYFVLIFMTAWLGGWAIGWIAAANTLFHKRQVVAQVSSHSGSLLGLLADCLQWGRSAGCLPDVNILVLKLARLFYRGPWDLSLEFGAVT